MRTVVLFPDGVGIRNFVLGPFLALEAKSRPVTCLHRIPDRLQSMYGVGPPEERIEWGRLDAVRETPASILLRYSLSYAHMHWARTMSMRAILRRPPAGSWKRRGLMKVAGLAGRLCARPSGIRMLSRWHSRIVGRQPLVAHYRRMFQKLGAKVVFCTHQRPPSVLGPVLAARSLGIPTATFIFSWDNLTSKGRIAAPFDHYLVWSDHMAGELLRYYPDVTADRVHVVGTPQFDPYADPTIIQSREEFFLSVGADPRRPLICYSGGDRMTAPDDPYHARVLMELVRGSRIRGEPQVLLRPAPVDDGERYDALRRDFPEMIYARPAWEHASPGDWSQVFPTPEDVRFLANLTRHADINVNLASTMTLDFAIHDKPVVNIAFDATDPPRFGRPYWEYYYRFEHYRPVVELGAARFAREPAELAEHVNAYLADPSLDREGRRMFVELEVGRPVGRASDAVAEALDAIARGAA